MSTPSDRPAPEYPADNGARPEFVSFLLAERDAAVLHDAARTARESVLRSGVRYRRLSDLLDECLPAQRDVQDSIARAVSMPPTELDGLRRARVDPLTVSAYALLCLGDAFGVPPQALRNLVEAEHQRFPSTGTSARGQTLASAWAAFDEASARLTAENPARFTTDD